MVKKQEVRNGVKSLPWSNHSCFRIGPWLLVALLSLRLHTSVQVSYFALHIREHVCSGLMMSSTCHANLLIVS